MNPYHLPEYVGIAAIYEGEANKYIYPDLMIKIQVTNIISSKYIYYVLLSLFNRRYFSSKSFGTQKSMPKINQNVVLNALIPLPSLAEQNIIVEKLTMLLNKCNQLQNEMVYQSQYLKSYTNALFIETFGGMKSLES
jgi:type I restriction enzyme S subunit